VEAEPIAGQLPDPVNRTGEEPSPLLDSLARIVGAEGARDRLFHESGRLRGADVWQLEDQLERLARFQSESPPGEPGKRLLVGDIGLRHLPVGVVAQWPRTAKWRGSIRKPKFGLRRRGPGPKRSSGASSMVPQDSQTKMAVGLGGQVVGGRAVAQMGVDDHAEAFELVEVPVDGREVDVGGRGLDLGGQLLGRAVMATLEETAEEEPAGGRDPAPVARRRSRTSSTESELPS
jgi:hypothetical protein